MLGVNSPIRFDWLVRWLSYGTESFDTATQRRLRVINALATITPALAVIVIVALSLISAEHFKWPIILTAAMTPWFLLTPFLWRFGVTAGTLYNLFLWIVFQLTFSYLMGRETGTHMLFLAGSVASMVVFGIKMNKFSLLSLTAGLVSFTIVQLNFKTSAPHVPLTERDTEIAFFLSISIFLLCVVGIVTYAFTLVRQAEALLEKEHEYSENLLNSLMPKPIATRLKRNRDKVIADRSEDISIMFVDIVNFTAFSRTVPPETSVALLNDLFIKFDEAVARNGLEKIKTIGDAYMVVGNLTVPLEKHVDKMADLALEVMQDGSEIAQSYSSELSLRIGFHVGAVVAGVIGSDKPFFDVWGVNVNIAARLESSAPANSIYISRAVKERLGDDFGFKSVDDIYLKGLGTTQVYELSCINDATSQ